MSNIDLDRIASLMLDTAGNLAFAGMPQRLAVQAMEAVHVYITDTDTPLERFDGKFETGAEAMTAAEKAISDWNNAQWEAR